MRAGAAIYLDVCAACHKSDGTGVANLFPNLAASSSVASREPTSLIRVVLRGTQSVSTADAPTGPAMPAFGWQLSDAEVAAVLTYIRNSWGHGAARVTERNVRNARARLTARND
jgi:mono/diheme cytochrome c family protein